MMNEHPRGGEHKEFRKSKKSTIKETYSFLKLWLADFPLGLWTCLISFFILSQMASRDITIFPGLLWPIFKLLYLVSSWTYPSGMFNIVFSLIHLEMSMIKTKVAWHLPVINSGWILISVWFFCLFCLRINRNNLMNYISLHPICEWALLVQSLICNHI